MLSFIQLKSFIELYATGSFSKAAINLSTTQPTMTKRIQQIESFVGKQLLLRSNNTSTKTNSKEVVLTEDGRVFLAYAEQIIRNYELMDSAFMETESDVVTIYIYTTMYIFHTHLSDIAKKMTDKYHNLNIVFEVHGIEVALDSLKKGVADIIFVVKDCSDDNTRSDFILEYEMGWFANQEIYEKVLKIGSPKNVFKEIPLITYKDAIPATSLIHKTLKKSYVYDYTMRYGATMDIRFELVCQGFGIGFLPKRFVSWNNERRLEKVLELDLIPIEEKAGVYSGILNDNSKIKYYEEFFRLLKKDILENPRYL